MKVIKKFSSWYRKVMWSFVVWLMDKGWQSEKKEDDKDKGTFLDRHRGKRGFLGRVVLILDRLWLKERVIGVLRITKEE